MGLILLRLAASAERRQTHPVARAILEQASARGLVPAVPDDTSHQVGFGIRLGTTHRQRRREPRRGNGPQTRA